MQRDEGKRAAHLRTLLQIVRNHEVVAVLEVSVLLLSRAFTSPPPRSPPRRPTGPARKARWYPKELQPPLLPQIFPPHRFTLRKHLPLQQIRQERPQVLASLMEMFPGDLVDLLTRNGTFSFLEDLHETGRLWDLRNFRIPRLVPRGADSRDFGDSLKAILALAELYPAQSLPLYILRAFAQFLPALLMPCSRHGKPRHVSLNALHFQKREWESLWNQTLKHNNRELAHRAKKLDGNTPAPASIRAGARYAEYYARKGALSKANQAMTSDLTPSAAPTNINELRAKNPEPTHPNRDPVTQPGSLIWPQKADTDAWWEEEDGQEYIC
jgi:hypothetical protein